MKTRYTWWLTKVLLNFSWTTALNFQTTTGQKANLMASTGLCRTTRRSKKMGVAAICEMSKIGSFLSGSTKGSFPPQTGLQCKINWRKMPQSRITSLKEMRHFCRDFCSAVVAETTCAQNLASEKMLLGNTYIAILTLWLQEIYHARWQFVIT